jgi:gas vesicle protein
MDKNGLSSFLMGLGVGVAIGMLFAPKSGEETRNLIKSKAGEGTDYLKQRSSELRQNANEWVDKGKEAIRGHKESLSDAMEAGRQAYRDAVSGQSTGSEV